MTAGYRKIIQYIDAHIKDDITIADISDMAGYSAPHIYRLFRVYSPYPVMEYIRRKKLYSAAGELYTGRGLYDVALDYGYETPAGFYKAFKSVFGCSPSAYRNTIMKEGRAMRIDQVKSIAELERGLAFVKCLYPGHPMTAIDDESEEKCGRRWWIKQFEKNPGLLLYAADGDAVCAVTFGFEDCGSVTVHEGVLESCRKTGVFEALFAELEKRAKARGFPGVALGIAEGEEEFYAKLGYTGKTLIQSEKYSIEELLAFIGQCGSAEVTATNVYEGHINQLWLNASLLDKKLKQKFEEEIGDCWVQVIACKSL